MAHHKKGRSKRKGSSCKLCKPQKSTAVKKRGEVSNGWGGRVRSWKQEYLGWLAEWEQKEDEGL